MRKPQYAFYQYQCIDQFKILSNFSQYNSPFSPYTHSHTISFSIGRSELLYREVDLKTIGRTLRKLNRNALIGERCDIYAIQWILEIGWSAASIYIHGRPSLDHVATPNESTQMIAMFFSFGWLTFRWNGTYME